MFYMHDTMLQEGERGEKRERGITGRIVCIVRESRIAKSARPVRRGPR